MGMINIRWSVAQAGDETSNGQPSVKRLLLIVCRQHNLDTGRKKL